LQYQKLLREAFMLHAEEKNYPIVHTRHAVSEVHGAVWNHIKPFVSDMLQTIRE